MQTDGHTDTEQSLWWLY